MSDLSPDDARRRAALDPTNDGPVAGERDKSLANRMLSVQSRVSNVLALSLMSLLGVGTLTWYYAHAMQRDRTAREAAHAQSLRRVQGDLGLPSLGRIDPPTGDRVAASVAPQATIPASSTEPSASVGADATPLSLAETVPAAPLSTPLSAALSAAPMDAGAAVPPQRTAAQTAQDRQLSGAVFAAQMGGPAAGIAIAPGDLTASAETLRVDAARSGADLGALLRPTVTPAARALVLPGQRLLLPKGAFIDCTLETAIDSTLPGMTTCVTATDTFGADGKVVLLERGTKLVGEVRGQVQQGAARLFVLWTEARTPTGVIVPLDSPGADELGRAGVAGDVNRHFWQRFGAAILVSVIDGAVQAAVQSTNSGNGAVIYNPSGSQSVMTDVLKGTIDIPPTIVKPQGDRVQVLVARDLDFAPVYALRSTLRAQ
jgi:type IV secretion system protein VirB10